MTACMMCPKKYLFFYLPLFLIFFNLQISNAQSVLLQGTVVDAKTNERLPFVHITVNKGALGTISDIDGKFKLLIDIPIEQVVFSYVGYEPFIYEVKEPEDLKPLRNPLKIQLFEQSRNLAEITVSAGENPAHRLIKEAVRNRRQNHPNRIKAYQYEAYHKFYLSVDENPIKEDSVIVQSVDTSELNMQAHLEKHHLFLSESIIQYQHKAPWNDKKTVLAQRVAGFQNPDILALAGALEPFDFYKDHIEVLNKTFLNPISVGSTEKYFFNIEDTVLVRPDTIYIISFSPYPNKNFLGLQGYLAIHTKGYALQSMQINTIDPDELISLKAEQKYDWVENRYWFPTQTNAEIRFNQITLLKKPALGVFKSYVKNLTIAPTEPIQNLGNVEFEINENAHKKTEDFWQANRLESIDFKEENTYQYLDSLGKKNNFDAFIGISKAISTNRVAIKWLDLDLGQLLRVNRYEGIRTGLGFYTNPKFNQQLTLGAYAAYGFRDKAFKFGTSVNYQLWQKWDLQTGLQYADDVLEPGMTQFWEEKSLFSASSLRYFITERMDRQQRGTFYLQGSPYRFTQMQAGISLAHLTPGYEYVYFDELNDRFRTSFSTAELYLKFRFVFGESYARVGQRKILIDAKTPALYFNFIRGIASLGGEFDYQKYEAKAIHTFRLRNLGETRLTLIGGWLNGNVPYPILFNGQGVGRNVPVVNPDIFQTMDLYEFANNQFLNLFWTHNFGQLLYKSPIKFFQPELVIAQSIGIGSLNNLTAHRQIQVQDYSKGYFESGVMINNILRFRYMDLAYFGLGGGVYFRYGAYRNPAFFDNTFFRLSTQFSF